MKKFLLTLLVLTLSLNSYGFGIGLQTGGTDLEFLAGSTTTITTHTLGSYVTKRTATVSNIHFTNYMFTPSLFRRIGLTMGFGSIDKPLIFWGINYYTTSWIFHNNDPSSKVSNVFITVDTTVDYRWLTLNLAPWFCFYSNAGLGFTFNHNNSSISGLINNKNLSNFLDIYARLPLGLSFKVIHHLEFFTEGSINLGVKLRVFNDFDFSEDGSSSLRTDYKNTADFLASFTLNTGIRYWF